MKNSYCFHRAESCTAFSEIIKPILLGLSIGAVIMGIFFGGKAAGRKEILRSNMWTDVNGTIYIDTIYSGIVTHENLAQNVYGRK